MEELLAAAAQAHAVVADELEAAGLVIEPPRPSSSRTGVSWAGRRSWRQGRQEHRWVLGAAGRRQQVPAQRLDMAGRRLCQAVRSSGRRSAAGPGLASLPEGSASSVSRRPEEDRDALRGASILPALRRTALPFLGRRALLGPLLGLVLWLTSWGLPRLPKGPVLQYLRVATEPHLHPSKASTRGGLAFVEGRSARKGPRGPQAYPLLLAQLPCPGKSGL